MDEIIQRLYQQRNGSRVLLVDFRAARINQGVRITGHIAPTALQDDSPVIGGILDTPRLIGNGAAVRPRIDLDRHNLHAAVGRSVASGYAADCLSVTVDRANRTGHVRTVSCITVIVYGYAPRIAAEIVAEIVSGIAVSIVILVRTVDLVLVDPHIRPQIRMRPVYTFVHYGHDDRRVARTFFPCFKTAHVCTGFRIPERTVVDVVPLFRQLGVVKRLSAGSCGLGTNRNRHRLAHIIAPEFAVEFDFRDFAELRQIGGRTLEICRLVETHHVPEVQSRLP